MGLFDPVSGQQVFGPQLPSYEDLQGCIRCGRCLPVCPTYQQTQLEMFSPRGRLSLLRAVEDGKLDLTAGVEEHLYHCLDCRACNTVCPPGVRIGELILRGRVAADFGLTGGVHSAEDLLKAVMAGASVTLVASELLMHGFGRVSEILNDVQEWMETHEYTSIQQMKGSMSQQAVGDPSAFERANYMRVLSSY